MARKKSTSRKRTSRAGAKMIEKAPEDSKSKEDFEFDVVTGGRGKKPVLARLNKTKLSKFEMDELFCEW